jgi:hypothetical protein
VDLTKKEETTCIGNGNSGENPKRFNGKEHRKIAQIKPPRAHTSVAVTAKAGISVFTQS